MHVEGLAPELAGLHALFDNVGIASRSGKCGNKVLVCEELVEHGAGFDHAGPADESWNSVASLKIGRFLASIGSATPIGPAHHLSAVIGRINNDGVVGNSQIIDLLEQLSYVGVMLYHAVGFNTQPGFTLGFLLEMGEDVHAS